MFHLIYNVTPKLFPSKFYMNKSFSLKLSIRGEKTKVLPIALLCTFGGSYLNRSKSIIWYIACFLRAFPWEKRLNSI